LIHVFPSYSIKGFGTGRTLIKLSDEYNSFQLASDFIKVPKVISDKEGKKFNVATGTEISKADYAHMLKKGDFNLYDAYYYKKVYTTLKDEFNNPIPLFKVNDKGEREYFYKLINVYGDGNKAVEMNTNFTPSAIDNGSMRLPNEMSDEQIVSMINPGIENEFVSLPTEVKGMTNLQSGKEEFNKLPGKSSTPTMTYAGIGSRETPKEVMDQMTELAKELESRGYTLRSGGAQGADTAFERGATSKKEIFPGGQKAGEREMKIAREIHPNPQALDNSKNPAFVWNLMARNTNQVFGKNLNTPVDFVIAYTQDGLTDYTKRSIKSGGTGQAIDMASRKGIPVINLANPNWRQELDRVLSDPTQTLSGEKINIYAGTGENAELSNFAIRPFKHLGIDFKSVEQAFQFYKTEFSPKNEHNKAVASVIKDTTNGKRLKELGREFKGLDQKVWDNMTPSIMKALLKDSFEQNPNALAKLLATGNAELTHTQDKGKWGKEFPRLLMEVREELRPEQVEQPGEQLGLFGDTITLKDGKQYNKTDVNSNMLEALGYTPKEIGRILKSIC
jgi:ribA/ribD-fused uncharacterized protein